MEYIITRCTLVIRALGAWVSRFGRNAAKKFHRELPRVLPLKRSPYYNYEAMEDIVYYLLVTLHDVDEIFEQPIRWFVTRTKILALSNK